MFKFLKKFFKDEEEHKILNLELKDLKPFFNDKAKEITKDLNEKIKHIKTKIDYEIDKTKRNLANLKKAELRNPNVPIKAKQFMDGNRLAYLKAANNFLDTIVIANNYDEILKFCDDFNDRLIQFAKSTTKAYKVLQEFFAHESRDVALNIKKLDILVKEIKKLIKEGKVDKLKQLKEDILAVHGKKEHRINLDKELKEKESKKQSTIKLKQNLERLRHELKASNEYAEFLSLNELKKKSLKELEDLKAKVYNPFSSINAALKKYQRITIKDVSLLEKYIDDPVRALLADKELKILDLLKGARKNILDNKIELKDKKKDKSLAQISRLTKEFFIDFKNKYKEIIEKINDLNEKIKQTSPNEKLLEFEEKLNQAQEDLEKLEKYMAYLGKEIEKIDFGDIKRELEKKIKDVFNVDVSIS